MKLQHSLNKEVLGLDLTLQTKDAMSHKIVSENPDLVNMIRDRMITLNEEVMKIIEHECQVRFPEGVK